MIGESELILNDDGTVFHLHLLPEQISGKIILVGDPGRVKMVRERMDRVEYTVSNREFVSCGGFYKNQPITVISTGIGTDNSDIVLNELDALANIDFRTREIKETHTTLQMVRIGTTGGLQADLPVNSWIVSRKSMGFDGMLVYYHNWKHICDRSFEKAFRSFIDWPPEFPTPYVVDASETLLRKFTGEPFIHGVNISAPGFYGPQGRVLRLALAVPDMNEKLEKFRYGNLRITNYEMESSAIYGLSALMGHEALTVCLLIAQRVKKQANENYQQQMEGLVEAVLDQLTS